MAIAYVDVAYDERWAAAAAVWFSRWEASGPQGFRACLSPGPMPYRPGELYLRELPAILQVLRTLPVTVRLILVDGHVFLDGRRSPGLGAHLYQALEERKPVVGVAKSPWPGAPSIPVFRGRSLRPLWVSAAGVDPSWAAKKVALMAGKGRLPVLFRLADRLAREALQASLTYSAGTDPPPDKGRG